MDQHQLLKYPSETQHNTHQNRIQCPLYRFDRNGANDDFSWKFYFVNENDHLELWTHFDPIRSDISHLQQFQRLSNQKFCVLAIGLKWDFHPTYLSQVTWQTSLETRSAHVYAAICYCDKQSDNNQLDLRQIKCEAKIPPIFLSRFKVHDWNFFQCYGV